MYKKETQLAFEDFVFPFGELDSENEWVKLAGLIPWDTVERAYAKQFVDNGHPAHSARIALGALIIKQRLRCSDEWTVRHVSENPYLQFFLGMKAYSSKAPFGASTMVEFRKRFPPEAIATILEASIPKNPPQDHDDQGKPGGSSGQKAAQSEPETPSNSGTLLMDATCCPADIAFPQDFQLLNHARELLEDIVRETCMANGWKTPRMYSKIARKSFLNLSKSKKRSAKAIRKCIRQQLQFIRRDIGYIADFVRNKDIRFDQAVYDLLNTLTTLYEQQLYMHEHRVHSVPDRIISILSHGCGRSSGARHTPTRNSARSFTSAWWTVMPGLSGFPSMLSTKPPISSGLSKATGNTTDATRRGCWQTRFTETGKPSPGARSVAFSSPDLFWAVPKRTRR